MNSFCKFSIVCTKNTRLFGGLFYRNCKVKIQISINLLNVVIISDSVQVFLCFVDRAS